ncbi:MAG: bifunctional 2',3'-cyclic-nucleotide 2'-phosphodiesterase/3'-nucleotidase [Paracoccaceae bacterium]|nr:MAG: bifunctional 2',3'-cyclic-nucleotide 2'-phosphodiesterase/3'-nucleotidase [Paracoccaceae bacterium]
MTGAIGLPVLDDSAFRLRILATSDLHAHVYPWDYHADRPNDAVGLARTARLIDRFRVGATTILLDNGDFLLGCPIADRLPVLPDGPERVHPVIAAMNGLGYDAVTLGNHEFNHGLSYLRRVLADAAFPVISANTFLVDPAEAPGHLVPPFVLVERDLAAPDGRSARLRIGVIGFLPPQTMQWDSEVLAGRVETRDILATARDWVPRLRAAGADIVVALAHAGIGAADPKPGMEDAATALGALTGVDAIIAGHSHMVFPSPGFAEQPGVDPARGLLNGTPAVMPGAYGSHLGVIDLSLTHDRGGWRVTGAHCAVHPVFRPAGRGSPVAAATVDSCERVLAAAAADHAATLSAMRETLGHTWQRLTTHFALVSDTAAMRAVAAAQVHHIAPQMRGTPWEDLPLLAAAAPFKAGGRGGPDHFTDIPAGPVARRNLADLYPFPNRLRALQVTGAGLVEWLERAAAVFLQIRPGIANQPLIDHRFPGYNFDAIADLSYVIDPTAPARYDVSGELVDPQAHRIRDLRHLGRPVGQADRFVIVTSNFRIATWPRLSAAEGPRAVLGDATTGEGALVAWAQSGGALRIRTERNWRLHLPPGTSALLQTSPAADPADLAGSGLVAEPLGQDDRGFALMRLTADAG